MSRMRPLILCLAFGALLSGSHSAVAQYYYPPYPPYSGYPSGGGYPGEQQRGYGGPSRDGYDYEPSRRPRVGRDYDDDLDNEQRAAPSKRLHPRGRARVAALPADADPNYSTSVDYDDEVDAETTASLVDDPTGERSGAITIDTKKRKLYLSVGAGQAIEYGIGVGREGFAWKGVAQIGRKAFWPGWTPPPEMLLRRPDLPRHMDGGMENPLGARALYLFKGDKDSMFRIHGTNEPDTIGQAVSSGCIRMLNADVIDLYRRVSKGARVVVR
jgi:lipoprotein-anchoring transpeptidase ErfK/SrfK